GWGLRRCPLPPPRAPPPGAEAPPRGGGGARGGAGGGRGPRPVVAEEVQAPGDVPEHLLVEHPLDPESALAEQTCQRLRREVPEVAWHIESVPAAAEEGELPAARVRHAEHEVPARPQRGGDFAQHRARVLEV